MTPFFLWGKWGFDTFTMMSNNRQLMVSDSGMMVSTLSWKLSLAVPRMEFLCRWSHVCWTVSRIFFLLGALLWKIEQKSNRAFACGKVTIKGKRHWYEALPQAVFVALSDDTAWIIRTNGDLYLQTGTFSFSFAESAASHILTTVTGYRDRKPS